jgi:hypothetical protein
MIVCLDFGVQCSCFVQLNIVKHVFQNLIDFFFIKVHGDVCTKSMTTVGRLVFLLKFVIGGHQQVKRGDKINIELLHLFS